MTENQYEPKFLKPQYIIINTRNGMYREQTQRFTDREEAVNVFNSLEIDFRNSAGYKPPFTFMLVEILAEFTEVN